MTLIWKTCSTRTSVVGECTPPGQNMGPSAVHCPLQTECVCECDGKAAKALNPNFARCTEMVSVTGIFYASELYFKYR